MALAGSKIQIMNGVGTNLYPRTRTTDMVDPDGNPWLDANGKISAKFLPSYVDDVIEVKYMQGTSLAVYSNATHSGMYFYQTTSTNGGGIGLYYGNGTKWISTQACTSDEWVQGNTWQEGKIYINTYDNPSNGVFDTYRWAGTAPVRITQDIASTTTVRAHGTADNLLVPTEAAVAAVSSALDSKITNKGIGVASVTGTQPIQVSGTAASRNVTLHYGTGSTYGAYLDLVNTTSIVAKAKLTTGASNGYGTVAVLSTISANVTATDFSTVFQLSGMCSATGTQGMTSTYLVPSIKLLHDVMSAAQTQYKPAVSSVTQAGSTMTFSRLDGTTFTHTVTSAQYAAVAGNGGVKSLTSKTDGIALNATTGAINISGVAFTSANASTAGKMGMVPAPAKGDQSKFLKADGTWALTPAAPIQTINGSDPISVNTNGTTRTVYLKYGTANNNGVNLVLHNTSIIASATLANGTSTGKGTVTTIGKLDAYGAGATANAVVFSLSALVSGTNTSAQTSTYWVPSIKLFHDVMSTAVGEYKNAVSSVTQAGSKMTFSRLDGTTFEHTVTSAQYAASAGAVAWGNVAGRPTNIVNTVTSGTEGIAVSPTSGDVKVSGVVFKKPSSTSNGQMGMVPGPTSNINTASAYLRADGTWSVPPNSTYTIPITGVVGITPVSAVTNNKITSVHLHYGTGSTYGVYLELANTTSLVAKGKLTNGTSAAYGTVATLGKLDAYGNGSQAVFSLSGWVSGDSTKAMTSTYLVPSVKLLHDVASAAANEYKSAVKSIDSTTGNTTINYTRLDGTTGSFKYQNTTYTAATAAECISNSNVSKLLNPSVFNSKIVQSMGITGTTDTLTATSATATSLYIPSQRAILNNCLFYSTLA